MATGEIEEAIRLARRAVREAEARQEREQAGALRSELGSCKS